MRYRHLPLVAAAAIASACASSASTAPSVSLSGDPAITWGPAPEVFPPGAQIAVLEGDPTKTEEFTIRLRMPAGYKIPAHTHPTDENVTVVSGQFKVGMGAVFNEAAMKTLPQGGFVTAPKLMAHYAMAVGETIVQVHALGPFAITYVNPAEAPQRAQR